MAKELGIMAVQLVATGDLRTRLPAKTGSLQDAPKLSNMNRIGDDVCYFRFPANQN